MVGSEDFQKFIFSQSKLRCGALRLTGTIVSIRHYPYCAFGAFACLGIRHVVVVTAQLLVVACLSILLTSPEAFPVFERPTRGEPVRTLTTH